MTDFKEGMEKMGRQTVVMVGERHVPLKEIVAVALGKAKVRVSKDSHFIKKMRQTQAMVLKAIENDVAVYGVNTGYGKSCGKRDRKSVV